MRKEWRKTELGFERVCFHMATCLMIVIFKNVSQIICLAFLPSPKFTIQRGDLAVSRFKGAGSMTEGQ